MKKAFTLIELVIVIIIIGILGIIAITQYANLNERTRRSEFNRVISLIRTAQLAYYNEEKKFTDNLVDLSSYIKLPPQDCNQQSHWFSYRLGSTINCPQGLTSPCFSLYAERCVSGGKNPPASSTYTLYFAQDKDGIQSSTEPSAGGCCCVGCRPQIRCPRGTRCIGCICVPSGIPRPIPRL